MWRRAPTSFRWAHSRQPHPSYKRVGCCLTNGATSSFEFQSVRNPTIQAIKYPASANCCMMIPIIRGIDSLVQGRRGLKSLVFRVRGGGHHSSAHEYGRAASIEKVGWPYDQRLDILFLAGRLDCSNYRHPANSSLYLDDDVIVPMHIDVHAHAAGRHFGESRLSPKSVFSGTIPTATVGHSGDDKHDTWKNDCIRKVFAKDMSCKIEKTKGSY